MKYLPFFALGHFDASGRAYKHCSLMRKNHSILDSNIYGTKYQLLDEKHKRHKEILNNSGYKAGLFHHIFDIGKKLLTHLGCLWILLWLDSKVFRSSDSGISIHKFISKADGTRI